MSVDDAQEEILDVSTVEDETTMQPQNDEPVISQKNGYLVWHSLYHALLDYLTFNFTCTLMQ